MSTGMLMNHIVIAMRSLDIMKLSTTVTIKPTTILTTAMTINTMWSQCTIMSVLFITHLTMAIHTATTTKRVISFSETSASSSYFDTSQNDFELIFSLNHPNSKKT